MNLKYSSSWGLKGRAIAFCVLLLAGTVLVLSGSLIWQQHRVTLREIRDKALVHAQSLGEIAESAVLLNDVKALQQVVSAGSSAKEFALAGIISPQGKQLAHHQRNADFKPEMSTAPEYTMARFPKGKVGGQPAEEWTSNQLGVIIPILSHVDNTDVGLVQEDSGPATGQPIGYLTLVYSLDELHERLARNILVSVMLSTLVIAVGIVVTILTIRPMLKPLENLSKTAGAIALGDMSQRAPENSVAEIGELARSFNHMADKIRQYTEGLEAQVMDRTAALSEALRRAEAATVAKSEFLANMSHEIRTPMTAILGYTDILIEQSWGRDSQEPLAIVKRNGQYLLQIINDILDLSKIESGKLEVERIRVPVTQLIAEVSSLMRVRSEAKNLSLSIEYATEIPETIETDPTRVRQILINLIGNSIKFTETGGVRLVVHLVQSAGDEIVEVLTSQREWWNEAAGVPKIAAGDAYLRLDVIDTGIGISPEMLDKLFQPFTQADSSMSRRYGGTGLGLTISRRLAQRLGGTIVVGSTPGMGSKFSLMIPTGALDGVAMVSHPSDHAITESQLSARQVQPARLEATILLAEDGPDNQRLISFVLKKAGAEVEIAENGKMAVEMIRAAEAAGKPFDVVLMDMQMPVLDGYGAVGQLRNMNYTGPIVALTAHAMSGDRDKCLAVGCTDYATKPIDRTQLIATIRKYLPGGVYGPQTALETCEVGTTQNDSPPAGSQS
jgi:signal transduction histidine kinase/DNA-binding NarL/FixJ family response regulator